MVTSCDVGSVSKYSSVSLDISLLSLHQSADLYLKLCGVVSCFEVKVFFKCNCIVATHAGCSVCIGDDGGV